MKEWDVSVTRTVRGKLKVEAETEEQARKLAEERLSAEESPMQDVSVKTSLSLSSSDMKDNLHMYEVLLGADLSRTMDIVATSESDAYDTANKMIKEEMISDTDFESGGIYVSSVVRKDTPVPPARAEEYVAFRAEGVRDFTVKSTLVLEVFETIQAESMEEAVGKMEDMLGNGRILTSDYETKNSYIAVTSVRPHKP